MTRPLALAISGLLGFGVAGCLLQIPNPVVQCHETSDCDQGEVCEQGVCWGDPPTTGAFAATLSAPASASTSLIGTAISELTIPTVGYIPNLALDAPVLFSGRVEASCDGCTTSTVAAQITLTAVAAFPGGPTNTLTTTSTVNATGDSFSLAVSALGSGATPYELTIAPIDDPTETPSPATVAPPLRVSLPLTGSFDDTYTLGGDGVIHLTGNLSDTLGGPLANYDVVARGQWNASEPPQTVSNIVHTLDGSGNFDLVLSADLIGTVDIVATPSANATTIGPTLTLPAISLAAGSATVPSALVLPATLGKLVPIDVLVEGTSTSGAIVPLSGVALDVTASVIGSDAQATVASLEVQATTGSDGHAQITVLDGMGDYAVNLVPPATSPSAATFAQPLDPVNDKKAVYQLLQRVALNGTVVDVNGNPVSGMQVTATPSQSYLWSLADAPQAFLESITLSPAATNQSGDFVVLVDPTIDGTPATYDLQLEPASETVDPHFTHPGVAINPTMTSIQLGNVKLPQPAFIHGQITDPNGNPVPGANLAVYLIISDTSACQAINAPNPCSVPAQQQAHAQSDGSGIVEFSLPR